MLGGINSLNRLLFYPEDGGGLENDGTAVESSVDERHF